jgi:hypothetical protein
MEVNLSSRFQSIQLGLFCAHYGVATGTLIISVI